MKKHHLIISGTGRAGTSFLTQLFTELGLDTGFKNADDYINKNANAGMEKDIRLPDAPYIIKDPRLCDYLDDAIEKNEVIIDHAIIPMRDLYSAAQSRREISNRDKSGIAPNDVPGGLWDTQNPEQQEIILAIKFYKLIYTIAKHHIPATFIFYPLFITQPEYLYEKIPFILGQYDYSTYISAFNKISNPQLVHSFKNLNTSMAFDPETFKFESKVSQEIAENMLNESLQNELENLKEFLSSTKKELGKKEKEIKILDNRCKNYKEQMAQYKSQIETIETSKSWRFVAFLKKIRRMFN